MEFGVPVFPTARIEDELFSSEFKIVLFSTAPGLDIISAVFSGGVDSRGFVGDMVVSCFSAVFAFDDLGVNDIVMTVCAGDDEEITTDGWDAPWIAEDGFGNKLPVDGGSPIVPSGSVKGLQKV